MVEPILVAPKPGFRLFLRYSDGAQGEVDLSHLAGRGVFAIWDAPGEFEKAAITPHRAIAWGDEVEICADALYLRLTGKDPAELLPGLSKRGALARAG